MKSSKRARDLCLGVRAGPKAAIGTRRRPRTSIAREGRDSRRRINSRSDEPDNVEGEQQLLGRSRAFTKKLLLMFALYSSYGREAATVQVEELL